MQIQIKSYDRIVISHLSEKVTKADVSLFSETIMAAVKGISQLIVLLEQAILDTESAKALTEFQTKLKGEKVDCFFIAHKYPFANSGEITEVLDYIANPSSERILELMKSEHELETLKVKIDSLYKQASNLLRQALGITEEKVFSPEDFKSLSVKLIELNKKLEHQYKVYSLEVERLLMQKGERAKDKAMDQQTQDRLKAIKQKALSVLKGAS